MLCTSVRVCSRMRDLTVIVLLAAAGAPVWGGGASGVVWAQVPWLLSQLVPLRYLRLSSPLGSGLVDHSQKMTVAARAMAEKKAVGQRS